LQLIFFGIFLSMFVGVLSTKIISFSAYDMEQNSLMDLLEKVPMYVFVLAAVVWAPITEELTFRLGLRFSKWSFVISLSFIFSTILLSFSDYLGKFFKIKDIFLEKYYLIFVYFLIIAIFIFLLNIFYKFFINEEKLIEFYKKYFFIIFYLFTFLFGFVHIFNWQNLSQASFAIFFLFLPQLAVSFVLGFIRMNYGISWSMFCHFFYNLFFVTPIVFLSMLPFDIFKLNEEQLINSLENLSEQYLTYTGSFFIYYLTLIFIIIFVSMKMIIEYIKVMKKSKI